jgi:small multidrug resistance pump
VVSVIPNGRAKTSLRNARAILALHAHSARMNTYLILGAAIVLEIIATSCLKASEGFTRLWPSLVTAAGYAGSFYCLSLTLKVLPIGVVYAIWSGVGIVLTAIVGWFIFKQRLDAAAIGGMALIVAGVLVINLFSKSATR